MTDSTQSLVAAGLLWRGGVVPRGGGAAPPKTRGGGAPPPPATIKLSAMA